MESNKALKEDPTKEFFACHFDRPIRIQGFRVLGLRIFKHVRMSHCCTNTLQHEKIPKIIKEERLD
jgi:hypothetical protein